MDIRSAAQMIRDTVSMDQILALYGYQPRHGFMVCPFHGDRDASLRVYKGNSGWHCFGCGKGGSVIDFVMEHEGCDFRTAVRAIDHACNLSLMDPHEHPMEAESRQQVQIILDMFTESVNSYLDALSWEVEALQRIRMHQVKAAEEKRKEHPEDMTDADYMIMLTWEEDSKYDDYTAEKINNLREEVAAWRRKARRTG